MRRWSADRRRSRPAVEALENRDLLATFFVTNTNDAGAGSLRQAILNANALFGGGQICFAIPNADPGFLDVDSALPGGDPDPDAYVIRPLTPLPALGNLSGGIVLDGRTQTASGDTNPFGPEIVLDGSGAGGTDGLRISSANNQVLGLNVQRFSGSGLAIFAGGGNLVAGNYVGTDATGTADRGNGFAGVSLAGTSGNTVGGTTPAARNVISGNGFDGIFITDASGNVVRGNHIGTDAAGAADLGNTFAGIRLFNAPGNTIGGTAPGAGNLISGNDDHGLLSNGALATGNVIQGNRVGTNAAGTAALGNRLSGVAVGSPGNLVGGTAAGARNLISGNGGPGVSVGGGGNRVEGNAIGTDISRILPLGNGGDGVTVINDTAPLTGIVIGGTTAAARNVISANRGDGVRIVGANATGNAVQGNYIGTDVTGTLALGNAVDGVRLDNAPNNTVGGAGAGNVISANGFSGVSVYGASGNQVLGNHIGTDVTGTSDLGNRTNGVYVQGGAGHRVGGAAAGEGNLISGNGGDGVFVHSGATGAVIQGNLIGTDVTGALDLGNSVSGVEIALNASGALVGGTAPGAGNVISGNGLVGITVNRGASGNTIQGNLIGTDATGTLPVGNASNGIDIFQAGNLVGGPAAGARNLISGNGGRGIRLDGNTATGNVVEGNVIGTDVTGAEPLGNGSHGVQLSNGARNNRISRNAIFANGGLGIDLGADGVTPNDAGDADAGPNGLQNFPVIVAALGLPGVILVAGTLSSAANTRFTLEFYDSPAADPSGHGEGRRYLGSAVVTTNAGGTALFGVLQRLPFRPAAFVTATATDPLGNTSEFSLARAVLGATAAAANVNPPLPDPTLLNALLAGRKSRNDPIV